MNTFDKHSKGIEAVANNNNLAYLLVHFLPYFVFRIVGRNPSVFAKVYSAGYVIGIRKDALAVFYTLIGHAILCSIHKDKPKVIGTFPVVKEANDEKQ